MIENDPLKSDIQSKGKKTAVITGGSNGVGYQIALRLLKENYRVMIVGRKLRSNVRNKMIEELNDPEASIDDIHYIFGNLADVHQGMQSIVSQIREALMETGGGGIHELIHNAGSQSRVHDRDYFSRDHNFRVNVVAPVQLTYLLLDELETANPKGRVQITSCDMIPIHDVDRYEISTNFDNNKGITMAYNVHRKRMMECSAIWMAKRLEKKGIIVNVVVGGILAQTETSRMTACIGCYQPWYLSFCCLCYAGALIVNDYGHSAKLASKANIWAAIDPEFRAATEANLQDSAAEANLQGSATVANFGDSAADGTHYIYAPKAFPFLPNVRDEQNISNVMLLIAGIIQKHANEGNEVFIEHYSTYVEDEKRKAEELAEKLKSQAEEATNPNPNLPSKREEDITTVEAVNLEEEPTGCNVQ
jgi:NAD(P)-dependent dehydrogenase (short-subunit alcohol dehydrogenase family)